VSSVPSVFISSISSFSSSFCRCCLCQVTRQLFPSSLVRVLWAVAFEYNGPVDAPSLPLWLHQYFLLSLSLSFLPPSLLQGSRLLCARLGFLQSSVLFAFLSAQSSVSSFVMMRSLVGPMVPPPPFPFLLQSTTSARMQSRTVYSPASSPPCQPPQECPARRIVGLATCLTLTFSG